jgi:hypothetical protein
VKFFNNIPVFVLIILFLMSATGIVVFQSHCACTGNNQVTVYVSPETCHNDFHVHHTHNEGGEEEATCASECHECSAHGDECGCNTPTVNFFKLDNRVVNEKIRIEKIQPVQLRMLETIASLFFLYSFESNQDSDVNYIDPPPFSDTSLDFLILIHQLKIPVSA